MDASIDSDLFWILDLFWTHFSNNGIMFLRNVLFPLFLFSHPGFPQLPQILLQTHSKLNHLPTRKDAEEDSSYSKRLLTPSLTTVIFSSSRLQDPLRRGRSHKARRPTYSTSGSLSDNRILNASRRPLTLSGTSGMVYRRNTHLFFRLFWQRFSV